MSCLGTRLRPALYPRLPFARDDAHYVRKVLETPRTLSVLDGYPSQLGKALLCPLSCLAPKAAAIGYFVKRQFAPPGAINLIGDDASIGDLAGGEHAGHDRRHRPGRGEHASAMDGFFPVGRSLRTRLREPALKAGARAAGRRPGGECHDLPGRIAGNQLGVRRTAFYQPRVEQGRADLQGSCAVAHCSGCAAVVGSFPESAAVLL